VGPCAACAAPNRVAIAAGSKPAYLTSAASIGRSLAGSWHGTSSVEAHRALLLADAERLENLDHARGVRAAVYRASGQHRPGRPVQAGISGDLAQQSDAGDRRPAGSRRQADLGVRVG